MSRPLSPIVCDGPGCGKQKQEANHWWIIALDSIPDPPEDWGLMILKGDAYSPEEFADSEWAAAKWFDFCGQDCALKFISEQMGKARGEGNGK